LGIAHPALSRVGISKRRPGRNPALPLYRGRLKTGLFVISTEGRNLERSLTCVRDDKKPNSSRSHPVGPGCVPADKGLRPGPIRRLRAGLPFPNRLLVEFFFHVHEDQHLRCEA
jgi:hypothetical protein